MEAGCRCQHKSGVQRLILPSGVALAALQFVRRPEPAPALMSSGRKTSGRAADCTMESPLLPAFESATSVYQAVPGALRDSAAPQSPERGDGAGAGQ